MAKLTKEEMWREEGKTMEGETVMARETMTENKDGGKEETRGWINKGKKKGLPQGLNSLKMPLT